MRLGMDSSFASLSTPRHSVTETHAMTHAGIFFPSQVPPAKNVGPHPCGSSYQQQQQNDGAVSFGAATACGTCVVLFFRDLGNGDTLRVALEARGCSPKRSIVHTEKSSLRFWSNARLHHHPPPSSPCFYFYLHKLSLTFGQPSRGGVVSPWIAGSAVPLNRGGADLGNYVDALTPLDTAHAREQDDAVVMTASDAYWQAPPTPERETHGLRYNEPEPHPSHRNQTRSHTHEPMRGML